MYIKVSTLLPHNAYCVGMSEAAVVDIAQLVACQQSLSKLLSRSGSFSENQPPLFAGLSLHRTEIRPEHKFFGVICLIGVVGGGQLATCRHLCLVIYVEFHLLTRSKSAHQEALCLDNRE